MFRFFCGTLRRMTPPTEPLRGEPCIPLPGTDFKLPPLGLGTWAWGDKATWGMGDYDRSYNVETIREAYNASIDAGVTLLDTAEMYGAGESERIIGRLMGEDKARAARVIMATKFFPAPHKLWVSSSLLAS